MTTYSVWSSNIANYGNYSGQLFQRPLPGTWMEINGILGAGCNIAHRDSACYISMTCLRGGEAFLRNCELWSLPIAIKKSSRKNQARVLFYNTRAWFFPDNSITVGNKNYFEKYTTRKYNFSIFKSKQYCFFIIYLNIRSIKE